MQQKIQISMQLTNGKVKKFDACLILAHINNTEFVSVLNQMNWSKTGAKDFLMGNANSTQATIDKPLSEKEAEQAVLEYRQLGYCK